MSENLLYLLWLLPQPYLLFLGSWFLLNISFVSRGTRRKADFAALAELVHSKHGLVEFSFQPREAVIVKPHIQGHPGGNWLW